MAHERVFIGTAHSEPGTSFPNSAGGVKDALGAGHQWLVFTEPLCTFESAVDLAAFPGSDLRLEGGGPGITTIQRGFAGGPILLNSNPDKGWRLSFTGLAFDGRKDIYATSGDLCEFEYTYLSHFENCEWRNSAGNGLRFHSIQAHLFLSCHFSNNEQNGLFLAGTNQATIMGGSARENRLAGYRLIGYAGVPVVGAYLVQGVEVVRTSRSAFDAAEGIFVDNAMPATIRNSRVIGMGFPAGFFFPIHLGPNTNTVVIQNNILGGPVHDEGTGNIIHYNS